jgi:hypothetical protein
MQRLKILSYVHIPEEIVLHEYKNADIIEEKTYDLYSIIVHRVRLISI